MRLKDLTKDDLSTMIEGVVLRYRVKCDELNNTLIRQTLQSELSNLLVSDFNDSFIKHCAGRFMISEKEEGNKPYGDLSAQFICLVIKKHKEWKAKENAKPKLIEVSKQLPMSQKTKEEEAEEQYLFIKSVWEKENKVPLIANWVAAFKYMERAKIISLDRDEKEMFLENVRAEITEEKEKKRIMKDNFRTLEGILTNPDQLKNECRKRMVINYFKNS